MYILNELLCARNLTVRVTQKVQLLKPLSLSTRLSWMMIIIMLSVRDAKIAVGMFPAPQKYINGRVAQFHSMNARRSSSGENFCFD